MISIFMIMNIEIIVIPAGDEKDDPGTTVDEPRKMLHR